MKIESVYPIDNLVTALKEIGPEMEIYVKYPSNEAGKRAAADLVVILNKLSRGIEVHIGNVVYSKGKPDELIIKLEEGSGTLEKMTDKDFTHSRIENESRNKIGVVSKENREKMGKIDIFLMNALKIEPTKPYKIAFSYDGGRIDTTMFFSAPTRILKKEIMREGELLTFENKTIATQEEYFLKNSFMFDQVREALFWSYWGTIYAVAINVLGENETVDNFIKRRRLNNIEKVKKHLAIGIAKAVSFIGGADIEEILNEVGAPQDYWGLVISKWASARRYIYQTHADQLIHNYNNIIEGNIYTLENFGFDSKTSRDILDDVRNLFRNHDLKYMKINREYLESQLKR
jgi:hypothetical protein